MPKSLDSWATCSKMVGDLTTHLTASRSGQGVIGDFTTTVLSMFGEPFCVCRGPGILKEQRRDVVRPRPRPARNSQAPPASRGVDHILCPVVVAAWRAAVVSGSVASLRKRSSPPLLQMASFKRPIFGMTRFVLAPQIRGSTSAVATSRIDGGFSPRSASIASPDLGAALGRATVASRPFRPPNLVPCRDADGWAHGNIRP